MTSIPTQAGYLDFIRSTMGINTTVLPNDNPVIGHTFDFAISVVNTALAQVAGPSYALAVYNLAGDLLINWAQDIPPNTYFADLRKAFGVYNFVPGVINESHDESTGQVLLNPDFMKGLQLSDLSNLKTPFGRAYLSIAQWAGPTVWGMS